MWRSWGRRAPTRHGHAKDAARFVNGDTHAIRLVKDAK
jgi:hypothetical protein